MVSGSWEMREESIIPWQSGTLYIILSSSLIGVMGVSLISPVLPDLRSVFAVSDAQVGLVITMYTLPGIALSPFVGLIADRFGRRRVIIPLLFIFGLGGVGVSVAGSFTEVLILRFVQGVGASGLVTLAITLIGDVYDGVQRNAVVGLNGSTIGTGAALYPVIGGALAGIRWNAPFLFFGIALLVGLVTIFVLDEPETNRSTDVHAYLEGLWTAAKVPSAVAIFGATFSAFFIFYGAILTALPLLLSDEFGLSAGHIGLILSMVALASAAVSSQYGRVSQWRSAPELVALGFVAYGTSLLGLWMAPSPLFVGVSLLAFGVGFGIVMPSIDTTVITLVTGRFRAGMMGMRTSLLRLGQTLGPVGFTFIAGTVFPTTIEGYRSLMFLSGTIVIFAGGISYVLLRR